MKVGRAGVLAFPLLGPGVGLMLVPVVMVGGYGVVRALGYGTSSLQQQYGYFEYVAVGVSSSVMMFAGSTFGLFILAAPVIAVLGWWTSVAALRRQCVDGANQFTLWAVLIGMMFFTPVAIAVLVLSYAVGPYHFLGSGLDTSVRLLVMFVLLSAASAPLGSAAWRIVARATRPA